MSLLDVLNNDMKQAMKSKDKEKLNVIRMVKASLQNESIHLGKNNLTKDEELTILSRELKQRNDSLHEFEAAGREDLVKKLEAEINILQEYMPKQLSDDELEAIVQETIQEVQATSKKDMGKVMSAIMPKIKGRADGSKVNKIVISKLN
ncbi:GatB/YqeY domain-containing protein [Virgibacillus sp. 179-BFC.A HS]|uniref:GatB/YqeY domain-containing protein n=1 Tax=Tigheibacillus jepli TaxID=3035914 RepID=A0ABU5CGS8_9BACI|nr:GatB/YqeY domain-containing protein [Virgibacillus sp. 179-BFC.A HS]MDY0405531.1 GatB/YqeY domain-containing protein [Virgibacillus sp. 179-BFC.A HS]